MHINWGKISPEVFEKFCRKILLINGFSNIRWYGKSGGDRGRDLYAEKIENPLPNIIYMGKWIIQCKRFISRPPNISDLDKSISWSIAHKPDYLFFIITNTLTSDTKDWIEKRRKEVNFKIHIWEEQDIIDEIERHTELREFLTTPDKQVLIAFANRLYQVLRKGIREKYPNKLKSIPLYSRYPFLIKVVKNQKYNHVYIYFEFNNPKKDIIYEETIDLPNDLVKYDPFFFDTNSFTGDNYIFFTLPPRGGYTVEGAEIEGKFFIENAYEF
ncbi:MAG: restriction endonuclease [Candidatus Hodarchaeota archaeon]